MGKFTADEAVLRANRLQERLENAPLGEVVEYTTAMAWCWRKRADGKAVEPDVQAIADDFIRGIFDGLEDQYTGPDAEERLREAERVQRFFDSLKLPSIADLTEELAESLRAVLLYQDGNRLRRFNRALAIDIALVNSAVVRDLVAQDRAGDLVYTIYDEDRSSLRGSLDAVLATT